MVSFNIVTDSTVDLPEEYNIPFVPVHVYAGIAEFRDKIDFDVHVLEDLVKKGIKRRTSAPSVKDWMDKFQEIGKDLPILAITISSKISATFKSAEIAARMLTQKGFRIKVLDSKSGSIGAGLLTEKAIEMARAETFIDEALEKLRELAEKIRIYLVVSDMEAAARSGRLPLVIGKIGKFLGIHPIFVVKDGTFHVWKTVRGIDHVVKEFKTLVEEKDEVWVGAVGKNDHAMNIYKYLRERGVRTVYTQVDPAIGAHFGIGAFGISFFE